MLFRQHYNSSLLNSTHYAMLYQQNGDRIVTLLFVMSFYTMYIVLSYYQLRAASLIGRNAVT